MISRFVTKSTVPKATHHFADAQSLHPDEIAQMYLQLHRQHRSTWAFEVALRPWNEKW
jgi:hypothetical protein